MTERYVELHAASAFSFLEGASQPEELIERAVELEMPAMALLDRNGVYGSADSIPARNGMTFAPMSERRLRYRALARGSRRRHGCRISTSRNLRGCRCSANRAKAIRISASSSRSSRCARRRSRKARPHFDDLQQYAPGLVCLTGGDEGPLAAALMRGGEEAGRETVEQLIRIFGRRECLCRTAAASGARGRVAESGCDSHCAFSEAAGAGDQWRSLCHGIRPRDSGPLYRDSPPHRTRSGRPPAGAQQSAASASGA